MNEKVVDLFTGEDGEPRLLRGVAMYSGSPRLAELAIKVGFDTVWVELEHGPTDFERAEQICYAAEAAGKFATIRLPDSQRCHVLRALEVGARIVIVPMVNSAEQARQIVEFGKFPPQGLRGYNSRSRGVEFGINPIEDAFEKANASTHLFAQIETMEAVENLGEICAVPGLSGVLIGPGDLSVAMGCMAEMTNPKLIEVACDCIGKARSAGLRTGILVGPGPLLSAAIEAGCNLCFVGGDYTNLIPAWRKLLSKLSL